MPKLQYINWYFITFHLGTCLDCQILASLGMTGVTAEEQCLDCDGCKECHPDKIIIKSNTVIHHLV